MEITPLPWAWVKMPTYMKWDIQTGGDELILSFSGPVLEGFGGAGALGDWGALSILEVDAQFIIRAVNNHYQLLEALEETQSILHSGACEPWGCVPACEQARAAIDLAVSDRNPVQ